MISCKFLIDFFLTKVERICSFFHVCHTGLAGVQTSPPDSNPCFMARDPNYGPNYGSAARTQEYQNRPPLTCHFSAQDFLASDNWISLISQNHLFCYPSYNIILSSGTQEITWSLELFDPSPCSPQVHCTVT